MLGKKIAFVNVKYFCHCMKVHIMWLCEVKYQSPPMIIANQCGFNHFDYIPTIGLSEGIWLL